MGRRLLVTGAMAALIVVMAVGVADAASVPYQDNAECLECHSGSGIAASKVDFTESPKVDRATACRKCHWEPAGVHPYHQATWNCASCHFEMGVTNFAAIPKVSTAYGYFNSAASANVDTDTIHVIHANARWPGGVQKAGRQCASCHAAAACTACHVGSIHPTHSDHTWDTALGTQWPGTGPSATVFGRGTTQGNEYESNFGANLTCSNATCHDVASGASLPVIVEDTNASITYSASPAWARSSTTGYSGNTYRIANGSGATAEYTFTGQRIAFITDRGPYRGYVKIYLDNVLQSNVNLYSATLEKQYIAYTSGLLTGAHTIKIEVPRTKDPLSRDYYVVLDAFRVYPKVTMTLTNCVTCHSPDTYTGTSRDRQEEHGAPVDRHTPASSSYCTASGCHTTFTNISTGHAAKGYNCNSCHENPVLTDVGHDPWKFKVGITKECDTCHNASLADLGVKTNNPFDYHTPHGRRHRLNLSGSNYAETSADGTESGCTNAGLGCHGASQTSTDIVTYHTDKTSCMTGACHTSAGKATHHEPFLCADCHDGTYQNAADTVALYDLSPAGHYGETTHTADGGLGSVTANGGSASEPCATCHDLALAAAHTGISTPTKGTKVTCGECHNYNSNVRDEIKIASWTNDACSDCHNGTDMPGSPQHDEANITTVVTGTSVAGCGATGTNCHTTYDLHMLHRNAAAGCDLSGCHDSAHKNVRPQEKSCGTGGGVCHPGYTNTNHNHSSDAAKHQPTTTTQATATQFGVQCGACHNIQTSGSSLTAEHALSTSSKTTVPSNNCRNCHNNAASTTAITGNWADKDTTSACLACHTGGLAIHATANSTAHGDVTSAGCGNSGTGCHNTDDLSQVGPTNVVNTNIHSTCLRCHDRTATPPNLAWDPAKDTCGDGRECHGAAGEYNTSTFVHNGSTGAGLANGNDATHHTAVITAASYAGVPAGGKECSYCHSAGVSTAHGTISASGGSLTCTECHNDTTLGSNTIVKGSWSGKLCTACHLVVSTHTTYNPTDHKSSSTSCANTGAGCHTSDQLDWLHDHGQSGGAPKYSNSCKTAGCHAADKSMAAASKTCGQGSGGCHLEKTPSNHGAAHTLTPNTYNNTTVTGCTGSGMEGCHGDAVASYASTQYHPTAGVSCTTSNCHNAGATNHNDPAFNDPNSCTDCHGGGSVDYVQAPLVSDLLATTGASQGHYDTVKHESANQATAIGFTGGTNTATCADCHPAGTSGLTQLYNQHQNVNALPQTVGAGFSDDFNSGSFVLGGWTADYQASSPGTPVTILSDSFSTGLLSTNGWLTGGNPAPTCVAGANHAGTPAFGARVVNTRNQTIYFQKTFDLSAKPTSDLSLWYQVTNYAGAGTWYIRYSTTGAAPWTNLASGSANVGWTQLNVSTLPQNATVTIRFEFSGSTSWGTTGNLDIDEFLLTQPGTPVPEDGWSVVSGQARAIGGDATTRVLKRTAIDTSGATSINFSYDLAISGFDGDDSLAVQYSPDGTSWTTQDTWTADRTLAPVLRTLPVGTTAVQFVSIQNDANDLEYVDMVAITPIAPPVGGISLTCSDCHNYNARTKTLTGAFGSAVWNGSCGGTGAGEGCHNPVDMPASPATHLSSIPVANGSSPLGCGTSGPGCHNTLDLHELHKGKAGSTVTCGSCHLYGSQAIVPAETTCGGGTADCHATYLADGSGHIGSPLGNDATYHTATSGMTAKVDGTTYDTGGGNTCASCHSATLMTAHGTSATANTCTGCHNDSTPNSVLVIKTNSWSTKTCDECHVTNVNGGTAMHNTYSSNHMATGSGATGCGTLKTGCHGWTGPGQTLDVRGAHNRTGAGCTSTGTDKEGSPATTCHAVDTVRTTGTKGCGLGATGAITCHTNVGVSHQIVDHDMYNIASAAGKLGAASYVYKTTTYTPETSWGCGGCHFTDLVKEHTGAGRTLENGGSGCGVCHTDKGGTVGNNADDPNVVAAIAAHDMRCTSCHTGTADGANSIIAPHKGAATTAGSLAKSSGDPVAEFKITTTTYVSGHNAMGGMNIYKAEPLPGKAWTAVGLTGTNPRTGAAWTLTSMLLCSDCHRYNPSSAASGTVGASASFVELTSATTTTTTKVWAAAAAPYTGNDPTSGMCGMCHTDTVPVHTQTGSHSPCRDCHTAIPHTSARPRLTISSADALPYRQGGATYLNINFAGGPGSSTQNCDGGCGRHGTVTTFW